MLCESRRPELPSPAARVRSAEGCPSLPKPLWMLTLTTHAPTTELLQHLPDTHSTLSGRTRYVRCAGTSAVHLGHEHRTSTAEHNTLAQRRCCLAPGLFQCRSGSQALFCQHFTIFLLVHLCNTSLPPPVSTALMSHNHFFPLD
ncbi:hypothetical protein E2C01_011870 [Portunus trituberculatus]|uniref:Uncharacterized protein n=1 Tax=Portunus trituberculatus TaxID=210409 RepID=A0A5B7DCC8_PORTR|nr:hypothetical protein [Portunus trituberculatus]